MRDERGLTFMEALIVSVLMAVLGLMTTQWLLGSWGLWTTTSAQSHVRAHVQQALSRVTAELRGATRAAAGSPPNVSIPPAPDNTTLTLYLPADADGNGFITDAGGVTEWDAANPVQFVYAPAQRQLQRVTPGGTQVIANDVEAVTFADRTIDPQLNLDEVRVTLTLRQATAQQRAVSTTAADTVKLRN